MGVDNIVAERVVRASATDEYIPSRPIYDGSTPVYNSIVGINGIYDLYSPGAGKTLWVCEIYVNVYAATAALVGIYLANSGGSTLYRFRRVGLVGALPYDMVVLCPTPFPVVGTDKLRIYFNGTSILYNAGFYGWEK